MASASPQHNILGKFKQNHSIILARPSGCGKTSWVLKLLQRPDYFNIPPKRVVWCSKTDPPAELFSLGYPVKLFTTLPELDEAREHDLWVIDDLASELRTSKTLTEFFTLGVHHRKCIMTYLTQDIFSGGPENTTRTKNCHYLVAFKDPRNAKGVDHLGVQIFPRHPKTLSSMYEEATEEKAHSFLLMDFLQATHRGDRYCSNIFTKDPVGDPIVWYVPKS